MADAADRADSETDAAFAEALWQARRAPALRPKGACHFCDEPVEAPKLFCSLECAEDFEAEEEALKRMGRQGA
jgi:hypothetical protein